MPRGATHARARQGLRVDAGRQAAKRIDAYHVAWKRCRMERDGKPPRIAIYPTCASLEGTKEGKF